VSMSEVSASMLGLSVSRAALHVVAFLHRERDTLLSVGLRQGRW
jgi:hypothetical protein